VIATVDFDNPAPSGQPDSLLEGVFQGINFGTGSWRWSGRFGPCNTNSIYFDSSEGKSRSFTFANKPRVLTSLSVYTGGEAGTLTLIDDVNQQWTQSVSVGSVQIVKTNWTKASTKITISYTSGWDLGIDSIILADSVVSDKTPPTVSITAPPSGSQLSKVVAISANASDNVGITGVQFLLDGQPLGTEDTASPYSISWDTKQSANGQHNLSARARDAAGNTTLSSSVSVNTNNLGEPELGLKQFILQAPNIGAVSDATDVTKKLNTQIARIAASKNHSLFGVRLWGTAFNSLWGHGRAVAAVAQTLPYIDSTTRDAIKPWLSEEVDNYLLNSNHFSLEGSNNIGTLSDEYLVANWSGQDAFQWEVLYGLWAYAHYTHDWQRISKNWEKIKNLYSQCKLKGQRSLGGSTPNAQVTVPAIHSEIAGLMGMARLAHYIKDTTAEESIISKALERLNDLDIAVANGNDNPIVVSSEYGLGRILIINNYYDLTPDISRFLATYRKAKIAAQFNTVTNRFKTWFLSDLDHVADWMSVAPFPPVANPDIRPGEEGFQQNHFANPIFMVRAYILDIDTKTLRAELPLPQGSRLSPEYMDVFRLQHLTAIAHRHSNITWATE
jgi:hypothetical protein